MPKFLLVRRLTIDHSAWHGRHSGDGPSPGGPGPSSKALGITEAHKRSHRGNVTAHRKADRVISASELHCYFMPRVAERVVCLIFVRLTLGEAILMQKYSMPDIFQ